MTAIVKSEPVSIAGLETALIDADLSKMNERDRVTYYQRVCESLGLNPLTQPFDYLRLNGKLVLYAKRSCTEQLRKMHGVSLAIVGREHVEGMYVVTARATTPDGRADESIGAVPVKGLQGENLSNALMKAETKAKRRVTLSICGLAFLDESEADSVSNARPAREQPTLDAIAEAPATKPAAGGQRAETRPRESEASACPASSPATSGSQQPSADADGELLDAQAWRARYEAEVSAAVDAGFPFVGEDELGLPIPGGDEPIIPWKARQHSGKKYSEVPPGYLREVVVGHKSFAERETGLRLHALYRVCVHELSKEAKDGGQ